MSRVLERKRIFSLRQSLTVAQRHAAAHLVAKHVFTLPPFLRSQHTAFYLPMNGEINPQPIFDKAVAMQKNCYLPVLHPLKRNCLQFIAYRPGDALLPNRYGILEPHINTSKLIDPRDLDIVFTPLVGFDEKCNRLGMGGGYYDRTFQFLNKRSDRHKSPLLIGLAYEFQMMTHLEVEAWDVSLTYVVTDARVVQHH